MKYSKQKELIKGFVLENLIHPTAENVYDNLKPNNPNLSLGTVYRNLNKLSQQGFIKKISVHNGKDFFDGNVSKHYHIICKCCNKVFDVNLDLENFINKQIKNQSDIAIIDHNLTINGLCIACQNK